MSKNTSSQSSAVSVSDIDSTPEVVVHENKPSKTSRMVSKFGEHSKKMGTKGVSGAKQLAADFKAFLNKGNVVDLAVGLVMGAAFTAIVNSLVTDIITPFISLASKANLDNDYLVLRCPRDNVTNDYPPRSSCSGSNRPWATIAAAQTAGAVTWNWGRFINQVLNFVIISVIVFFIVKAYTATFRREKLAANRPCPFCLTLVPNAAIKCSSCCSQLPEYEAPEIKKKSVVDKVFNASDSFLKKKEKGNSKNDVEGDIVSSASTEETIEPSVDQKVPK